MSSWGNKDIKASSGGTAAVSTAGAVTGAGSADLTDFAVGDFLRVGTNDYVLPQSHQPLPLLCVKLTELLLLPHLLLLHTKYLRSHYQ